MDRHPPTVGPIIDPGNFFFGTCSVGLVASRATWLPLKIREMSKDGGDNGIDYPAILDIMKAAGYDGYCSIEYEPKDRFHELDDPRRQVSYIRRLIDERNGRKGQGLYSVPGIQDGH